MMEYLQLLLLPAGGSLLTILFQAIINRRKRQAETIKISADTFSIDIKNRQSLEEFYSQLLDSREDIATDLHSRLIQVEKKVLDLTTEIFKERVRSEELAQILRKNNIPFHQNDE